MRLLIINGPNLNLLGRREAHIYGGRDFEDFLADLRARYADVIIDHYQSNVEGEIINALQAADRCDGAQPNAAPRADTLSPEVAHAKGRYDGVMLNAGGYTHTSVAIADAVAAIGVPVVEVHISCILAREEFRHTSLIAPRCAGTIMGFGLDSYRLAVESFINRMA